MALDYDKLKQELITLFHLEQVSAEKQTELLSKMGEALIKRIFLETMEKIGDAAVVEYEALLDKKASPEEIEQFFESKIPGYNDFVEKIVSDFKAEMQKGIL